MTTTLTSMAGASLLGQWYQIAGIVIALPVVGAVIWAIIRSVRHMSLVHEAIIGRPGSPVSEPIPSMIERFHDVSDHLAVQDTHLATQDAVLGERTILLAKIDGRLTTIEGEFRHNSGLTVKDDLQKLRADMEAVKRRQLDAVQTAESVATALAAKALLDRQLEEAQKAQALAAALASKALAEGQLAAAQTAEDVSTELHDPGPDVGGYTFTKDG